MSITTAVGVIKHIRGETISFGLRATDPEYDGTEVITWDIKKAINGSGVPSEDAPVLLAVTPVFVPTAGAVVAHWLFTIPAAQSAALPEGNYITDAKMVIGGSVDYVAPLKIKLAGRVTA